MEQLGWGPTWRQSAAVVWLLALTAGFVNGVGLDVIGVYTSHVTGAVNALSRGGSTNHPGSLWLILVGCFIAGAACATALLDANAGSRESFGRGAALVAEAVLLGGAAVVFARARPTPALLGGLVAFAMGGQNSLFTTLSGAVVRTTHLTGVATDLGIELARWLRFAVTRGTPAPSSARAAMLGGIAAAFVGGASVAAVVTPRLGAGAFGIAACLVATAAIACFRSSGRSRQRRGETA